MMRKPGVLILFVLLALPLSASQFLELPFDSVAREATLVVRGSVESTWSGWDDAREVIYTYATIRVSRYIGETTGPDVLLVREVGGTVDGYRLEAIGFPELRTGEQVVLMLSKWEGSEDLRIHAFNQGKYLVRNRGGIEVLVSDPVRQGDLRLVQPDRFRAATDAVADEPGLTLDEFTSMVEDARAGIGRFEPRRQ